MKFKDLDFTNAQVYKKYEINKKLSVEFIDKDEDFLTIVLHSACLKYISNEFIIYVYENKDNARGYNFIEIEDNKYACDFSKSSWSLAFIDKAINVAKGILNNINEIKLLEINEVEKNYEFKFIYKHKEGFIDFKTYYSRKAFQVDKYTLMQDINENILWNNITNFTSIIGLRLTKYL